nr:MAG TPA: hypothetical protein [Caudoviricetes sp.]
MYSADFPKKVLLIRLTLRNLSVNKMIISHFLM